MPFYFELWEAVKADSKNGHIGVKYCDDLYPRKHRKKTQKYSKLIVDKTLESVKTSPFKEKYPRESTRSRKAYLSAKSKTVRFCVQYFSFLS